MGEPVRLYDIRCYNFCSRTRVTVIRKVISELNYKFSVGFIRIA